MTTPTVDVHAGVTAEQHRNTFVAVLSAIARGSEQFGLRPTTVSVSALFGLVSVTVGLPSEDIAGVDALADAYELPVDDASNEHLHLRCGPANVNGATVTLTVYTGRPGAPAAYVVEPVTAPMPVTAAQPAGATR